MKRFAFLLTALAVMISLCACGGKSAEISKNSHNDPEASVEDISVEELPELMKIGWNLGNTLDAPEGETSWGQPTTTKEMIDKIHELGFNTIRVPVSWGLHTSGSPDYTIDSDWLDRVEEVVNYGLDNDMFVIINSHHDNDFYYPTKDHEEESVNYIEKIWTQVADRFKGYDQHLIFQSMNEPRLTGTNFEWWIDYNDRQCLEAIEVINACNQKFVDVVRASGSRNATRFLLCSSYCGSAEYSLQDPFKLPEDSAEKKLLVSVHAYTPYNLAMGTDSNFRTFDQSSKNEIDSFLTRHYNKYVSQGVGVIVDEMGIINKNNPYDRQDWGTYYIAKAKSLGIVCCWWDNSGNGVGEESYGLFDRNNLEIFESSKAPYDGLMAGLETPLEDIKSSKPE